MPGHDPQEDPCAAFRLPATLLPVPQRTSADAHEGREPRLAKTVSFANSPHVWLSDLKRTRSLATATKDRGAFAHALPKLLEKLGFHLCSISTICRSALFCAAVRSACSLFANAKNIKGLDDHHDGGAYANGA